jgi:hypothetical protein
MAEWWQLIGGLEAVSRVLVRDGEGVVRTARREAAVTARARRRPALGALQGWRGPAGVRLQLPPGPDQTAASAAGRGLGTSAGKRR